MSNTQATQYSPGMTKEKEKRKILSKTVITAQKFAAAYIKHNHNGTQAYLSLRPDLTYKTAAELASKLLKTDNVQNELQRLNNEIEQSALVTRVEFINKMREIGNKAEKSKAYTPAISAWKEAGQVSGVYDRDDNEAGKYNTFINNLTVNVGAKPQDVADDHADNMTVEAQWEEVLDNQGVTEQD